MTEIFILIAHLPGVPKPLNKLAGCWETELPNGWRMAVNGHGDPVQSKVIGSKVPAFCAVFVHKETMAMACVSPFDGVTVGDAEDEIITALKEAGAKIP